MPFNAWGAFIMGLLLAQGISQPFTLLMQSIAYNFYPLLTLLLVFVVIWSGKDIGDMKKAETRAEDSGLLLRQGAVPMMDDSIAMLDAKEGIASFLEKRSPAYPDKVSTDLPDTFPWWEEPVYK